MADDKSPTSESAPQNSANGNGEKKKRSPVGFVILAVVAIGGAIYGLRSWQYNTTHASTDDAFVTSDIVPVNATISGSVKNVLVADNQRVQVGDLLVQLDYDSRQADVDQAEANLEAAKAAAGGASADVQFAEQTGFAQISQAQQAITLDSSDVAVATANAQKASSGVATAQANVARSRSDFEASKAVVDARKSAARRAREQLASTKALIESAKASLGAAEANLKSAQAVSANADKDALRAATLVAQGAQAAAVADSAETASATAKASVEAARQQIDVARSNLAQRKADLVTAEEQVREADAGVTQAIAQQTSSKNVVAASRAQVQQSNSEYTAAKEAISAAQVKKIQAEAKLRETQAAIKKINSTQNTRASLLARIKQAAAALQTAKINLDSTKIKALVPGIVSMKVAQIGQQVAPGQQMMAIIPASDPWIVANFKETQLGEIRPGLPVEIEIDAIPGVTYRGHVDSIARGTGATFALLPPDNATGNFTKVVQRVPIKIVFENDQSNMDRLRTGLSSRVSISLKG